MSEYIWYILGLLTKSLFSCFIYFQAVCFVNPRTTRISIKTGFFSTEEHSNPFGCFYLQRTIQPLPRRFLTLQEKLCLQDIKLLLPQHQSEPGLFCFFFFKGLLCLRLHLFRHKTMLKRFSARGHDNNCDACLLLCNSLCF